jgi:hypothetical protein
MLQCWNVRTAPVFLAAPVTSTLGSTNEAMQYSSRISACAAKRTPLRPSARSVPTIRRVA